MSLGREKIPLNTNAGNTLQLSNLHREMSVSTPTGIHLCLSSHNPLTTRRTFDASARRGCDERQGSRIGPTHISKARPRSRTLRSRCVEPRNLNPEAIITQQCRRKFLNLAHWPPAEIDSIVVPQWVIIGCHRHFRNAVTGTFDLSGTHLRSSGNDLTDTSGTQHRHIRNG